MSKLAADLEDMAWEIAADLQGLDPAGLRILRLRQEYAAHIAARLQEAVLSPEWPDGAVAAAAMIRDVLGAVRAASRRAVTSDDQLTVTLTVVEGLALSACLLTAFRVLRDSVVAAVLLGAARRMAAGADE